MSRREDPPWVPERERETIRLITPTSKPKEPDPFSRDHNPHFYPTPEGWAVSIDSLFDPPIAVCWKPKPIMAMGLCHSGWPCKPYRFPHRFHAQLVVKERDGYSFPGFDKDVLDGDLVAQPRAAPSKPRFRYWAWSMLPESAREKLTYLTWNSRFWDDQVYFSFGQTNCGQEPIKFSRQGPNNSAWRLAVQLRYTDGDATMIVGEVKLPRVLVSDQTPPQTKGRTRFEHWTTEDLEERCKQGDQAYLNVAEMRHNSLLARLEIKPLPIPAAGPVGNKQSGDCEGRPEPNDTAQPEGSVNAEAQETADTTGDGGADTEIAGEGQGGVAGEEAASLGGEGVNGGRPTNQEAQKRRRDYVSRLFRRDWGT